MIFEILGKPQGKARHRMTRTGHSYTPQKTVDYENLVKECYALAKGECFAIEPLQMKITAYFGIPKSTTHRDRDLIKDGILKPTKKPDADNIAKIVCDALNEIAYKDDSQIVKLEVAKKYADEPKVVVEIEVYNG